MRIAIPLLAACAAWAALPASAATPAELMSGYQAEAARQSPGFQASARRGAEFHVRQFGVSAKLPSCATCHGDNPAQPGRHAVTDKAIKPLAPAASAERFSDPAKVEKWFRRNCTEVVGRECSAAEKADFVAFASGAR